MSDTLKAKLQEIHRLADAVSGWSTLAGTANENAQRVRTLAREALALLSEAEAPRESIRAEALAIIAHEPVAFAECTVAEDVMARARRIVELTK